MLQSYSDEKHNNTDRFLRQATTRKSIADEAEVTDLNRNIKRTKNPFPDIHVFVVDPDVSHLKNQLSISKKALLAEMEDKGYLYLIREKQINFKSIFKPRENTIIFVYADPSKME